MNTETARPAALLDQLIATLLAFFGVPLAFARRVLSGRVATKRRVADMLQLLKHRKLALRSAGDSDAIVQARLDRIAWCAETPYAACKHIARQVRGWRAYEWMQFGLVPQPVTREMGDALADAFGFDAPATDTS